MTFRFGGSSARRFRLLRDDEVFEWRPQRRSEGRVFRDLRWEFEEPDGYPALVAEQKTGFMASKAEKEFHAAVAGGDPEKMLAVAGQHPSYQTAAKAIAGLLLLESSLDRGIALMEEVASGSDVGRDSFVRKYLPEAGLSVEIAAGLVVHLPLQNNSLALLLGELYQARDEPDRAIALLDAAETTTHIRLSLAELLFETGEYERVVAATQGVHNDDDVTALMLAYRGRALAEMGRADEAVSVFARVLEFPNRAEAVKAIALVGRGMVHQQRGDRILAENDFTLALLEVPDDPEAQQHIQELIHGQPPRP